VSIGWGLLLFFLGWTWIPIIIFAVKYWSEAKRPLILYAAGFLAMIATMTVGGVVLGLDLASMAGEESFAATPGAEIDRDDPVIPPPRPTALPTHPSWEAIVDEVDRKEDTSWEELVPSPTPVTGRSNQLSWDELNTYAGRAVVIELEKGTTITASLEGAEAGRVRVRHAIGGGEASYWIERDQVISIRLLKPR
jgi:hypothetical protein